VREHVFGYVLLNDWSARDIQAWEYQPLGPFLSKSFATSISPWVVSLDALEPFRVAEPAREPEPLPYLRAREPWAYDVELEMLLQTQRMRAAAQPAVTIARTNFRGMYWTVAQQLAHMTSNGSRIRPGDLFGTGTISGTEQGTQGSLIELTRRGAQPLGLPNGETRGFLEDGDTAIIRGRAVRGSARIGFGEVVGTIVA
jgi:fumarylacetoacetase